MKRVFKRALSDRMTLKMLSMTILIALIGCVESPNYFYAERITGRDFIPLNDQIGVYPDQSALRDPHNPFREFGVGVETKWEIEADGDPVAGFYVWATLLATQPTGEHQFYTALNLKAIYERSRADEADLELTRDLAIAGFQSVLDHFPESVTFDATGLVPYGLATLALEQIISLEGTPQGGWSLVAKVDGGNVAVQTLDVPVPEMGGSDDE